MQYKKRSTYTRFFISFLIATIVLEIGAVFFLPSSFGAKEVSAATCAGDPLTNTSGGTCSVLCKSKGYGSGTGNGGSCCCKTPSADLTTCRKAGGEFHKNAITVVKKGACASFCGGSTATALKGATNKNCCCSAGSSASGGSSGAAAAPATPPSENCTDRGGARCDNIPGAKRIIKNRGTGKSCTTICKENDPNDIRVCTMADTATQTVCCCGPLNSTYSGGGALLSCTTTNGVQKCDFASAIGGGIQSIAGNIIKAVIGIVGSLALLMFVWGGFLWLSAAGDEERIKKGSSTMVWATIGMAAIFGAYAIARFIIEGLFQQT